MTTFKLLKGERDVRSYDAGQTIFAEGAPADVMYAVIEGEVDIVFRGNVLATGRGGRHVREAGVRRRGAAERWGRSPEPVQGRRRRREAVRRARAPDAAFRHRRHAGHGGAPPSPDDVATLASTSTPSG